MRSKHILVGGILFQVGMAVGTAPFTGMTSYLNTALSAFFCILFLRQLPKSVALARVMDAVDFCESTNDSEEAMETFTREYSHYREKFMKRTPAIPSRTP